MVAASFVALAVDVDVDKDTDVNVDVAAAAKDAPPRRQAGGWKKTSVMHDARGGGETRLKMRLQDWKSSHEREREITLA